MIIAFANNQVMLANNSGTTIVYTDPVPMGDADRLTCNLKVGGGGLKRDQCGGLKRDHRVLVGSGTP